jgi:serine/threonine protein kinase
MGTLAAVKLIPKGMLLSREPKHPTAPHSSTAASTHKLALQAAAERDLLYECRHCPFVVDLLGFGQTHWSVYTVTVFVPGGELFTYLRRRGRFSDVR